MYSKPSTNMPEQCDLNWCVSLRFYSQICRRFFLCSFVCLLKLFELNPNKMQENSVRRAFANANVKKNKNKQDLAPSLSLNQSKIRKPFAECVWWCGARKVFCLCEVAGVSVCASNPKGKNRYKNAIFFCRSAYRVFVTSYSFISAFCVYIFFSLTLLETGFLMSNFRWIYPQTVSCQTKTTLFARMWKEKNAGKKWKRNTFSWAYLMKLNCDAW